MIRTDNETIYDLMARKLCGQASEVELRVLRELAAKSGFNAEEISEIEKAWNLPIRTFAFYEPLGQKEKAEELWQKSFVYHSTSKRKRINISLITRIAADKLVCEDLSESPF